MNLIIKDGDRWVVDGRKLYKFLRNEKTLKGETKKLGVKTPFRDFYTLKTDIFLEGELQEKFKKGGKRIDNFFFPLEALDRFYGSLKIYAHRARFLKAYVVIKEQGKKRNVEVVSSVLDPLLKKVEATIKVAQVEAKFGPAVEVKTEPELVQKPDTPPNAETPERRDLSVLAPKDGWVDARLLHEYLESQTPFSMWMHRKIKELTPLGFKDQIDYKSFSQICDQGRPQIDYLLSVRMGKNIAQLELTWQGQWLRDFFIVCQEAIEEELKRKKADIPSSAGLELLATTMAHLAQVTTSNSTEVKVLNTDVKDLKNKVEHLEKHGVSPVAYSLPEDCISKEEIAAKLLPGVSPEKISLYLDAIGWEQKPFKYIKSDGIEYGSRAYKRFCTLQGIYMSIKQACDQFVKDAVFTHHTDQNYVFKLPGILAGTFRISKFNVDLSVWGKKIYPGKIFDLKPDGEE